MLDMLAVFSSWGVKLVGPAQAIQHTGKDEGPIKYSHQDARKELLERLEGMAGRQLVEMKTEAIRQIEESKERTVN